MAPSTWTARLGYSLSGADLIATKDTEVGMTRIDVNSVINDGLKVYYEMVINHRHATYNDVAVGFRVSKGDPDAVGYDDGAGYNCSGELTIGGNRIGFMSSYTDGDIIGIAVDNVWREVYFSLNGVWEWGADPSFGSGGVFHGGSDSAVPAASASQIDSEIVLRSDTADFSYPIPTGYTGGLVPPPDSISAFIGVDASIDILAIGLPISVNSNIGISCSMLRTNNTDKLVCDIGIRVVATIASNYLDLNAAIGIGTDAILATQPADVNVDIGIGTELLMHQDIPVTLNCGVGVRASATIDPNVLFRSNVSLGLKAMAVFDSPRTMYIESSIGVSAVVVALTSRGININASMGLGGTLELDNGSPAIPCRLPKFSESRWC